MRSTRFTGVGSGRIAVFCLLSLSLAACNSATGGTLGGTTVVTPASGGTGGATTPTGGGTSGGSDPGTGTASPAGTYVQRIAELAGASACASHSWTGRGRGPAGFYKGMAVSYARSLCRLRGLVGAEAPAQVMSEADTHDDAKDALTHYESILSSDGYRIDSDGEATLQADYALGFGEAMRESSGEYCEGWDTSAGANRSSSAAEAGLFQTSYDSVSASPQLAALFAEYQANPQRCDLAIFAQGASCRSQSILGTGTGAIFQQLSKSCPAFATEYAMVVFRVLRSHYGPIIRREAEIVPACHDLLSQVSQFVDQDPANTCADLN